MSRAVQCIFWNKRVKLAKSNNFYFNSLYNLSLSIWRSHLFYYYLASFHLTPDKQKVCKIPDLGLQRENKAQLRGSHLMICFRTLFKWKFLFSVIFPEKQYSERPGWRKNTQVGLSFSPEMRSKDWGLGNSQTFLFTRNLIEISQLLNLCQSYTFCKLPLKLRIHPNSPFGSQNPDGPPLSPPPTAF